MFTDECSTAGDAARQSQERVGGGHEPSRRATPHQTPHSAVLIVEDEHVARRALGALLSASGYCTSAAESAEEALRLLQNQPAPRVALVDLNLPGMSGIDFIGRLEQIDPSVHAVLMTGAGDETLAAALQERPVHYVRKPLDFSRLLTLINTPPCNQ
jgi:DNA-binding NtrC family response regulator